MYENERPLVLVVCADGECLARTRDALRSVGLLPVSAPSVEGALNLLTQVVADGCVVSEPVTPEEAEALRRALDAHRARCPKISVLERQPQPLDGWTSCAAEELPGRIVAAFRAGCAGYA